MTPVVIQERSAAHWVLRLVPTALLAAVAVAAPFVLEEFRLEQVTRAVIFAVAILGLNLLTGFNGQISLGHSAFFGLGAYTTAVLTATRGDVAPAWNHLATVPVAAALCFLVGFIVGIPALRIRGIYLALVTLGLAAVFPTLVVKADDLADGLTGGPTGKRLPRLAVPDWTGLTKADREIYLYFLVLAVAAVLFLLARNLVRSRQGRSLIAVRDNEVAAAVVGVNLSLVKTVTFGISAMYAGIAGSLVAMQDSFVSPESFALTRAVEFLAGMVVGGVATIAGPLLGGFAIEFVPYFTSEIGRGVLSGVIFGAVLIVLMFIAPGGIVGLWRRIRSKLYLVAKVPPGADTAVVTAPAVTTPFETTGTASDVPTT